MQRVGVGLRIMPPKLLDKGVTNFVLPKTAIGIWLRVLAAGGCNAMGCL